MRALPHVCLAWRGAWLVLTRACPQSSPTWPAATRDVFGRCVRRHARPRGPARMAAAQGGERTQPAAPDPRGRPRCRHRAALAGRPIAVSGQLLRTGRGCSAMCGPCGREEFFLAPWFKPTCRSLAISLAFSVSSSPDGLRATGVWMRRKHMVGGAPSTAACRRIHPGLVPGAAARAPPSARRASAGDPRHAGADGHQASLGRRPHGRHPSGGAGQEHSELF